MKNVIYAALVIAAFALVSFGQSSKDDSVLKSTVRRLLDAQIAYDVKTLDALFTKDYIEISPLGEFDPREKVLGFYAPDKKPTADLMIKVEDTEYSIRNHNDHAVVITRLNYVIGALSSNQPPRSIRATYLLEKEKGNWKIASAQYTGIRPPMPPKQ